MNGVGFMDIFDRKIVETLDPSLQYPKWVKQEIKRKYKDYPALFLDVWIPYEPTLFSLLPKKSWKREAVLIGSKARLFREKPFL